MNTKRYILSSILVFVVLYVYDFIFHGMLLSDMYRQTAHLWRPVEQMAAFLPYAILSTALLALVLSFVYTRHWQDRGLHEGLRFGLYVGLIMGVLGFAAYSYLPIPLMLAVAWLVGETVKGLVVGIALSLSYRE